MAKNRTYTGGKQSVGTPTLNKSNYFQLIRKIRQEKSRQRQLAARPESEDSRKDK